MAQIDTWITLENHAWDACPSGRDRMSFKGKPSMPTTAKVLVSPVTGVTRTVNMRKPIDNALILRRYTPNSAAPADQKVNPWDMNEQYPTDERPMVTIQGHVM